MRHLKFVAAPIALVMGAMVACASPVADSKDESFVVTGNKGTKLLVTPLDEFYYPWAMTFLPDGRSVVTQLGGVIWLVDADGKKLGELQGGPSVKAAWQGGMGDIILHPDFAETGQVYLSYVERDAQDGAQSVAVVELAKLTLTENGGSFSDRNIIWRQTPKVHADAHYGHRLAVSPDRYLFITSGERQQFTPAQDMNSNLGKIVRLNLDGSVPDDNPFADQGEVAAQVWTLGHRNPLGIAFDASGRLWAQEMGPAHGDELNLIVRGENYGYPEVSEGNHYDGKRIPNHSTRPEFAAPVVAWVPAISPGGLAIYDGELFSDWDGNAFLGGLSAQALVRVKINEDATASEAERYGWGKRIREVETGPDGALYVLEDQEGARLLRLTPAN